jgi:hypothetical protein
MTEAAPREELLNEAGESLADMFRAYQPIDHDAKVEDDHDAISLQDIFNDLGSIAEIAATLGVGKARVARWIERRESVMCPAPVRSLSSLHIYLLSDWINWYRVWKVTRGSETWWTNRDPSVPVPPKPPRHRGKHRRHNE